MIILCIVLLSLLRAISGYNLGNSAELVANYTSVKQKIKLMVLEHSISLTENYWFLSTLQLLFFGALLNVIRNCFYCF